MSNLLVALCGPPKTGKTVSAWTFPKPGVCFNFDDGMNSVSHTKVGGELFIPDHEEIDVINFFRRTSAPISLISDKKGGGAPEYAQESLKLVEKFNVELAKLFDNEKKYQTLVIDSMTSLWGLLKSAILAQNSIPSIRLNDFGTLDEVTFQQLIPTLKGLNEVIPYIILVFHTETDKDEQTGKMEEFPVGCTKPQGRKLGKEFDEVWMMGRQGNEFVWRTKPVGFFNAGSRLDLPDPVKPATFQELEKYL